MVFEAVRARAPIILNVLRTINVVGLLSAAIASALVVFKTTQLSVGWWFFDTLSYVFTTMACFFLILSEVPVLTSVRAYYEYNWPLLSHHHGLSWLAVMMIMISVHVLGSLYNPSRSIDGPFRSMVLAGGILVFVSAFITFFASFFFSDRKNNVNARTLRSKTAAASAAASLAGSVADSSSFRGDWGVQESQKPAGFFGKIFGGGSRADEPTTIYATTRPRPDISGPIRTDEESAIGGGYSQSLRSGSNYRQSPPPTVHAESYASLERPANVAHFDDRRSPLNPDIQRPATKDHPFWKSRFKEVGLSEDVRYSEASIPRNFI